MRMATSSATSWAEFISHYQQRSLGPSSFFIFIFINIHASTSSTNSSRWTDVQSVGRATMDEISITHPASCPKHQVLERALPGVVAADLLNKCRTIGRFLVGRRNSQEHKCVSTAIVTKFAVQSNSEVPSGQVLLAKFSPSYCAAVSNGRGPFFSSSEYSTPASRGCKVAKNK